MDHAQARALLVSERARLQRLLQAATDEPQAADLGDEVDDADRRNAEHPLAELSVEEAAAAERGTFEPGDDGAGLVSPSHPFEVLRSLHQTGLHPPDRTQQIGSAAYPTSSADRYEQPKRPHRRTRGGLS